MVEHQEGSKPEKRKSIFLHAAFHDGLYVLAFAFLFVGIGTIAVDASTDFLSKEVTDFVRPSAFMLISIGITVLLVDVLGERRIRRLLKNELIMQMASSVQHFAIEAVEELRKYGWLMDGSISGRSFVNAQLGSANLKRASLKSCDFTGANLAGAKLLMVELDDATLVDSDFESATLRGSLNFAQLTDPENKRFAIRLPADLTGVSLRQVAANGVDLRKKNLEGVELVGAELKGATLDEAKLAGADLSDANLAGASLLELSSVEGLELHRAILAKAKLPADLSQVDFEGADLTLVDLTDVADMSVANFKGAKLGSATLPVGLGNVKMVEADLRGADLSSRVLKGANLTRANLHGANLTRADLSDAILDGAVLFGADLSGAILDGASFVGAKLNRTVLPASIEGLDFSGACFVCTDLSATNLSNAILRGANLDENTVLPKEAAKLKGLKLAGAHLVGVDLGGGASLVCVDLEGATLEDVKFSGATLAAVHLEDATITHVDFSEATLEGDVSLRGARVVCSNFAEATIKKGAVLPTDLSQLKMPGVTLEGVDLTGRKLDGTDLSRARLKNALLKGARFPGAKLCGAALPQNLEGVDFSEAGMEGVDLSGCVFGGTLFDSARLERATFPLRLEGVSFVDARLNGVDLRKRTLIEVVLDDGHCEETDFRGSVFVGLKAERTRLTGARMDGVKIGDKSLIERDVEETGRETQTDGGDNVRRSHIKDVQFQRVSLEAAEFVNALMTNCDFADATNLNEIVFRDLSRLENVTFPPNLSGMGAFVRSHIVDSDLTGRVFGDGPFKGARFRGVKMQRTEWSENADLTDAVFDDVDLSNAKMADVVFEGARLTNVRLDNADLRRANLRSATIRLLKLATSVSVGGATLRPLDVDRGTKRLLSGVAQAEDVADWNLVP